MSDQRPFDIALLTDSRYVNREPGNRYVENIFADDDLLLTSLEAEGLKCCRISWDHPDFDWTSVKFAIFRTTWDYFERIDEFMNWFAETREKTNFLNHPDLITWNIDKSYLWDLAYHGIDIPQGIYISKGSDTTLEKICKASAWKEWVLKPAVSGAAWNTYYFKSDGIAELGPVFLKLLQTENMILQEFLPSVAEKGEISLMMFGGKYSHAVLKKAKPGDFRVQDDFGGTLHDYEPNQEEINLAEHAMSVCGHVPMYARVDIVWDKEGRPCISELELIEPELWFRRHPESAANLANLIKREAESVTC
jgi:glutathione synthase/RimK-type ligase-like ATP-grasp enzyme